MRKMVLGAVFIVGVASLVLGAAVPANVTRDGTEEIRVFILDKAGNPIDLKNLTGAVDVTPVNGTQKSLKLEMVSPAKMEGFKEDAKGEGQERRKAPGAKELMLCGQVKTLDDWFVEMIFVRGGMGAAKKGEAKPAGEGFLHHHFAPYFEVKVDDAVVKDAKTGTVNFKATVVITMANGDTKYVKGFDYPEGAVSDVLGRLIDKSFKETSKMDHEQAAMLAHKIQKTLQALPPLSFKSDGDRQEYEKACQECRTTCQQLEQATGKDIADAADKCKSALKEVRSQAKDAQGALTAD